MTDLEDSIVATVAWFDIFDYPLTAWEAWKWRMECDRRGAVNRAPAYTDVLDALLNLVAQKKLASQWSYYFLPGREQIVETRRSRYLLARKKFARARRITRWFRFVPFVRLIAVCNTLGYSNASAESDIDFFIVTAPGKIWTVRGVCLLFLQIFHLRPALERFGAKKEERRDKIDLSFFVTQDSLDVTSLALQGDELGIKSDDVGEVHEDAITSHSKFLMRDPYLMYWLVQLTPLWDRGGVYQKFWEANAALRARVPHAAPYDPSPLRAVTSSRYAQSFQRLWECILGGHWIESTFKWFQIKKMPTRIKDLAGRSDGVVLRDAVLKFHDIDRRREYRARWENRLRG